MKLSEYAHRIGVSYKTAYRLWRVGKLDAYQLPTGTVIVREVVDRPSKIVLYARVSSADQKSDLQRQLERLRNYAAAKGYVVFKEVSEIAAGVKENRPQLTALLGDSRIGIIVVEHQDRLTRFGFNYLQTLLEVQKRQVEVINQTDTGNDLVDDFVAVITSMAARIYGKRNSKRRAERIKQCIETWPDHD